MMLGPKGMATSVRKPNGEILTEYHKVKHMRDKSKFFNLPIIRGVVNFVESMIIGYKALMYSAEVSGMEDVEAEDMNKFEKWLTDKFGDKLMNFIAVLGSFLGVALAAALFLYFPILVFNKANEWSGGNITAYQGLIEGVIKIIIFVAYMAIVGNMKDIKRLFMYHGAEHKCINCIEHGLPLTVENVRNSSRQHKRCGTSFLFFVLAISIILLLLIRVESPLMRVVVRIVLLPVIAGVSYEFLSFAGKHDSKLVDILSRPGMWMQGLTTKEPDDSMIQVAIAAVEEVFDWKKYLEENFPETYPAGYFEEQEKLA